MTKTIIRPAFAQKNIPVVFASDKKYLPYLGVAIYSLIKNSSAQYNYDLFVLHDARYNFANFPTAFFAKKNVSLRFIPLNLKQQKINFAKYTSHHLSQETFFRLLIPELFSCFDKVIYLDSDLIVLDDIAKLYYQPIGRRPLAATRNIPPFIQLEEESEFFQYLKEKFPQLAIKDYFCAAVLIFNLKFFPSTNFSSLWAAAIKSLGHPRYHDQDILNVIFDKKIYFLAPEWNLIWFYFFSPTVAETRVGQNYLSQAKIIHFASDKKPWVYTKYPLSDVWWRYAKQTPFIRVITWRLLGAKIRFCWETPAREINSLIHLYGSLARAHCQLFLATQKSVRKKQREKIATLHFIIKRDRKVKQYLKRKKPSFIGTKAMH